MKHPITDVIFPLHGNLATEAYAWSKELARLLKVPFSILINRTDQISQDESFMHELLEGDGYYFSHYAISPPKTRVLSISGDFTGKIIQHLQFKQGSIVVILPSLLNKEFYQSLLKLKQHAIVIIPNRIDKVSEVSEFDNILQQVALHHLPFHLFSGESNSLIYRVKQNIQSFLRA